MAVQYRIGEFANLSGVSAKTLRFYDEIGLLRPASIDSRTRYRHYLSHQLEELAAIVALKEFGVPLNEIRNLTTKSANTEERRELLRDFKTNVEHSIARATQSLTWINAALEELDNSKRLIPIVVKRLPAVLVASTRTTVRSYDDITRFEEDLLRSLPERAVGRLRGVLWHRCADSGTLEGEAFVALKQRVPARSFYDLKHLSAATLACAYSTLDDTTAEQTYCAIRKWMVVRGYQLAGPKREIYLDRRLEIQYPLKSA